MPNTIPIQQPYAEDGTEISFITRTNSIFKSDGSSLGDSMDAYMDEVDELRQEVTELDAESVKSSQLYTHNVASVTAGNVYTIGNISGYLPEGANFVGIVVQGSGGSAAYDFCVINLTSANVMIFKPSVTQQSFQIKFRVLYTL